MLFAFGAGFLAAVSCGRGPSPRDVTIEFVGSVIEDDTSLVQKYLDLDAMAARRMSEMSADSTVAFEQLKRQILSSLTGDGQTRAQWMKTTPVVDKQSIRGDSAQVELTFLDRAAGKVEYYKVFLRNTPQGWRVQYFE